MSIVSISENILSHNEKEKRRTRILILVGGLVGALLMAYFAVEGLWPLGLVLLAALPGFVILHRYPFATFMIWLLLTPFLIATESGMVRRVYWIIHRVLPPATIAILLLSSALRIHRRTLPRLLLADLGAAGYVVATLLSIMYQSDQVPVTIIYMYDHVFIPVCLYFLVRLLRPQAKDLKRLLPIIVFTLITQAIIGLLSWTAPQLLPDAWLSRVGTRTTGSLISYSVFSATAMFCGLYLLHSAYTLNLGRRVRYVLMSLFLLSIFMVFFSFSRGSWLAGLIVIAGLFLPYRKLMLKWGGVAVCLALLLFGTGILASQAEYARQRFRSEDSEESALSRLPVIYASIRMFEQKPLFGWGYENFDKYDYQFQRRVGNLISPDKDHASHNVYLSILAEMGLSGLLLFLTPVFGALAVTAKAWPRTNSERFVGQKLIYSLWLVIVFHVVVNNFSNMRIEYGQAIWWVTLALIITLGTCGDLQEKRRHE